MIDTKINLCGVVLKNPVTTASGTFGSGEEYADFVDLNQLGAITVKGVSSTPWKGNPPPRIAETYGGMLNSVGLQNPGVDYFIKNTIPFLEAYDTKIIVNVCGNTIEEYIEVVEKLSHTSIDLLELNISCPNIAAGGIAFGTCVSSVEEIVTRVKKVAKQPLFVKLSPNVTDITEIAKAAESSGADGLSLINTLLGMKIDIKTRAPVLANKVGGLSGPAIKPVAIQMVYRVSKAVSIPIIGMGGISNADDAIEFLMAGATSVAIGTANFSNPIATIEVIEGINDFLIKNKIKNIKDIIGVID